MRRNYPDYNSKGATPNPWVLPMDSEVVNDALKDTGKNAIRGCVFPLLFLLCALFFGAGWFSHAIAVSPGN